MANFERHDTTNWDSEQVRRSTQSSGKEENAPSSHRRRRRKKNLGGRALYLICVVAASAILAGVGWLLANDLCAFNKAPKTVVLEVTDTDTFSSVASRLKEEGLVEYKWFFKLFGAVSHASEKIEPGVYELNTDMDYRALIVGMHNSSGNLNSDTVRVTIPEGYTVSQIIKLLAENGVNTEENLLDPGDTPMENLQFLVFLAAVIKAVDEYADLLRTSVATPGNDHRLGANEAPPAIISIFVGEELEAVIDAIASDSPYAGPVKMKMDLGVDVLPKFSKDTTDRNRTSPFAFTGNKFEFRMPGSAENLSDANTILNTAVAKELKGYADELESAEDFTSAAIALVKRTIRDHRRVIFNGNGYTAEWEEEAAKRGLPNKKNTPAALPALIEPKNIALMEDFGVLTKVEMESRYEVEMEHYSKIINIEALTMLEMARKQLLPAVNAYMSEVANTAASKLAVSESLSVRSETKALTRLSADADAMSDAVDELQAAVDAAKALSDESVKAVAFHDDVLPKMDALRAAADDAETICGEDYWPLPSYSKMLYYV